MKAFLLIGFVFSMSSAMAGLRYSHLVFECENAEGVHISVLRPGPGSQTDSKKDLVGKVMALNTGPGSIRNIGIWCASKANENNKRIRIKEAGEIIGEDPSGCKFEINKNTLLATYEYKQWRGYVRGVFSRPEIHTKIDLKCEPRDEMVDL